jgi:regulator of replication initiation timing
MDTIFIWLIAGAAIGLLGIFLVASERELKRKRQELDELKHQLADVPAPGISNASADVFSQEYGASAELMARNKDLLDEVSSLSKKLEASESRLEQLETLRAHLNSKESEITELRWERERLQSELAALKTPSASSEPPTDEAMQNSQKDAEIALLKEQLEASQAKVRDLESAQIQPAAAESGDKAFEELQRSLEVSTLQLQNALAAEQEKQKALEATQLQLVEMQQRHHELSAANLRLQEENSQHQQKLTNQNQVQVERLVILRQRLEQLRLKQAEVSQQERVIQEEILGISQLLDVVPAYVPEPESSNSIHYARNNVFELAPNERLDMQNRDSIERDSFETAESDTHVSSIDKTNGFSLEVQHQNSTDLTTAIAAANQASGELSRPALKTKKRRFGIFSAVLGVLAVSGVFAAGFFSRDSERKPSIEQLPPPAANKQPTAFGVASNRLSSATTASATSADKPTPENRDDSSSQMSVDSRSTKTSDKTPMAIASERPVSKTWESYEIVRPTRVFSAPSEHSRLVADIEPGTQVNVVDSRNGWLEIRSKHGRPPGFIQKTAAVRIGQN